MNVIFFGTPEFGKIVLEGLIQANYKPILVVTAPDAPVGRKQKVTPPPVKALAGHYKIPVIQQKNLSLVYPKTDLIIVAAYGQIIPKKILDWPKYGALNLHPSLLPRWRGPSPIQYAILSGNEETGVTIIKMDEQIDHGPIIASLKYQMTNTETTETLTSELAELGSRLLIETIPKWTSGKIIPQEQNHKDATYSGIITKQDGHINWGKSAQEIERQIRAFTPWPGSFTFWNSRRIEIFNGSVLSVSPPKKLSIGQVLLSNGGKLAVQTGKGLFIIEELQIEGKNKITIKEFLNGYSKIIGATLI